jgi:Bacterial Ig-like domain
MRRLGRTGTIAAALAAAAACANIQPPPGGPPDTSPPQLVAVYPDSPQVGPQFDRNAEFRFNEVVSEGSSPSTSAGTGDLQRLVILSPTNKLPDVSWHRSRITVRPAEGWKPNRVYRVELLPGVADVRRNVSKAERIITFSTGAPLPSDTLRGTVIDWKSGRPAPAALVEAVLQPDSLPYRIVADSGGRFTLGPIPKGQYLVYGVLDQNRNLRRDPREAFDSVRIAPDSHDVGEVYAFVHDTLPPRIQSIDPVDSVTATITFAQSLDPLQKLDSSQARVLRLPDSAAVPVVALQRAEATQAAAPMEGVGLPERGIPERALPGARDTTKRLPAAPDTTKRLPAVPDTSRRAPGAQPGQPPQPQPPGAAAPTGKPGRPPLSDRLTLKVAQPWHPGDRLSVEIHGVRTVSGVKGDARGILTVPKPRAPAGGAPGAPGAVPDSLRQRGDSARTHADSTRARTDSLRGRADSAQARPDTSRGKPPR